MLHHIGARVIKCVQVVSEPNTVENHAGSCRDSARSSSSQFFSSQDSLALCTVTATMPSHRPDPGATSLERKNYLELQLDTLIGCLVLSNKMLLTGPENRMFGGGILTSALTTMVILWTVLIAADVNVGRELTCILDGYTRSI